MNQTQLVQYIRTTLPEKSGYKEIGNVQILQTDNGKALTWLRPTSAVYEQSTNRKGFRKLVSLMRIQTANKHLQNLLGTNKFQPIKQDGNKIIGFSILLQDIPLLNGFSQRIF